MQDLQVRSGRMSMVCFVPDKAVVNLCCTVSGVCMQELATSFTTDECGSTWCQIIKYQLMLQIAWNLNAGA